MSAIISRSRLAKAGSGEFAKTELPNGIRVVTETVPSVRSASIGVWFDVGSRFETPAESGMSHFIEHMVFKGTKNRNARQIASSLESIGGSLNAFTSREQTCYTARVLDEHIADAIDVLADLSCNATFTQTNLDRERDVICEEIKESLDNPADLIHDLFSKTFWADHPLGQPILGPAENIRTVSRAAMLGFRKQHYRAGSVVVAASGSISHRELVNMVKSKFSFPAGRGQAPLAANAPTSGTRAVVARENSQTHVCMGFPGPSYGDHRRMAALVLNAYLGGGMSSVLFQKVREEKGLAYSVYSFLDLYKDSGIFGAYVGTDKEKLDLAIPIILREFAVMKRKPLPETRLAVVKEQIKGQLTLGLESTSSRMNRIARLELMLGLYQPLSRTLKEIDKVSSADIQSLANDIFDEKRLTIAVLGPVDSSALSKVA